MALYDRVRALTYTVGTGSITLGAAVAGYRAFTVVADGDASIPYVIEDGQSWEIGIGTWDAAEQTLTRSLARSSTGSLLNLSGRAQAFISPGQDYFASLASGKMDATGSNAAMTDDQKAFFLGAVGGMALSGSNASMDDLDAQDFRFTAGSSPRRVAAGPILQGLAMGQRDLRVLILGDSTGYDTCPPGGSAIFDPAHAWPRLTATALGLKYPAYTVTHRNIDVDASLAWLSPVNVQTGTGSYKLEFWDGSVPGSLETWPMGGRWTQMVTDRVYDLIIVSYGHNYPNNADVRDRLVSFISDLRRCQPAAPILMTLQNWGSNSAAQKRLTRDIIAKLANEMGLDTYDAGQQFELYGGNDGTTLNGDGTHPTIYGQQVWSAGLMGQQFNSKYTLSLEMGPSPLLVTRRNYMPDPYFQRPLGPSGSANRWLGSAGDVALAQQGTIFETSKVWGDQAAQLTSDGSAEKYTTLTLTPVPKELLGQTVTWGVRMYRAAANAVVNRNGLRVDSDSGNLANSDNQIPAGDAQDGFFWRSATFTVPSNAAYLLFRLNIAQTGSALTGKLVPDRNGLWLGDMVHDPATVDVPDHCDPYIIDGATGSMVVDLGGVADPRVPRTVRFTNLVGNVTVTNFTNAPQDSEIRVINGSGGGFNVTITRANAVLPAGADAVLGTSDAICLLRGPVYWEALGAISANS